MKETALWTAAQGSTPLLPILMKLLLLPPLPLPPPLLLLLALQ